MKIEVVNYIDMWQQVKNAAMNTVGAESGNYPTPAWKRKILLAEHSPIRELKLTVRITDVPYWVVMHLVRHKVGIEHYVKTQRTDRTGIDRTSLRQDALVDYTFTANAQAFIAISRKRLCNQAAKDTRDLWLAVLGAVNAYEPELVSVCYRECVYRGFCPEMKCCGYTNTDLYKLETTLYHTGSAAKLMPTRETSLGAQ